MTDQDDERAVPTTASRPPKKCPTCDAMVKAGQPFASHMAQHKRRRGVCPRCGGQPAWTPALAAKRNYICSACRTVASRTWNRTRKRSIGPNDHERKVWLNMKKRCGNRSDKSFSHYGGRGISVHPSWRTSFFQFLSDMGPCPSPLHSLDRIDNDGDYAPGNCRWATRVQQANNMSRNRYVIVRGERLTVAECARRYSIPYSTLYGRLRMGWSDERAALEPVLETRRNE